MITIAFSLAIIAAVIAVARKRWQRHRAQTRRPGSSIVEAIVVERFDEIDAVTQTQICAWCDHRLVESGETSRTAGNRRYRIVRLVCSECERAVVLFFDVTHIFH